MLVDGVAHLRPEDAVFEAMLAGWARKQTSRQLLITTIEQRESHVRRLATFTATPRVDLRCGRYPPTAPTTR
jgi:hypothetical protein